MEYNWKSDKKTCEERMTKTVEVTQSKFNSLRVGGAHTAILDRIMVPYFGAPTPLSQIATLSAASEQLLIEPFEKTMCKEIEKAIISSDLNLTPTNDGSGLIKVKIPRVTQDRRKLFVKQAKTMAEDGKVAIRNIRRDIVDKVRDAEKKKDISKDNSKDYQVRQPPLVL